MPANLLKLTTAKPFLKWAGGKAQLVPEILSLISSQVSQWEQFTYIEPFVGGGAILFAVLNKFDNIEKVVINDINPDLITAYQVIQSNPKELIENLKELQAEYYSLFSLESKQEFFLQKREEFNRVSRPENLRKTVLLFFLNKTCFNGLYRVNSQGLFNVPFGKYTKPTICQEENLIAVHHCLQNVEILQGDFAQTFADTAANTLFYFDPPYKPIKKTSAFTSYAKEYFTDEEQIRLKKIADRVDKQGSKFILSNSDVKNFDPNNNFFDELYQDYCIKRVKARRNINSKGDRRGEIFELIVTNF